MNTRRRPALPRAVLPVAAPEAETAPAEGLGAPLSIHQAAQLIGCSPWTIRQTLMPRGLPCFRCGRNGKLIFYQHQLIRWIVRHQRPQGGRP